MSVCPSIDIGIRRVITSAKLQRDLLNEGENEREKSATEKVYFYDDTTTVKNLNRPISCPLVFFFAGQLNFLFQLD